MSDQDVAQGRVDAEPARKAVAKHALIDPQGNEVDSEESATGIRYTLLGNGKVFEYQYGTSQVGDRMLALFGAKTLATNETSQARNNPKGAGSHDEQFQAVADRFEMVLSPTEPKWIDRTREGVAQVIDKPALVEAICQQFAEEGKAIDRAALTQRLEEDKQYVAKARKHLGVATKYAAIVGKASVSTDDLAM